MRDIHLIVQYYKVKFSRDIQEKQREVDYCLQQNAANPYIKRIHLLVEEQYDLTNIVDTSKINQVVIGKRLTYHDAFEYYNTNLSGRICMLSNADIYFDSSLDICHMMNYNNIIYALNRYEHSYNEPPRRFGTQYNLSLSSPWLEPYQEAPFAQDVWIWSMKHINVIGCDFNLGTVGCDNFIANKIVKSGYVILNVSQYLCAIHYDHLSEQVVDDKNKSKGGESFVREKRVGDFDNYTFLEPGTRLLDVNTSNISNCVLYPDADDSNKRKIIGVSYDNKIRAASMDMNKSQYYGSSYVKHHDYHNSVINNRTCWMAQSCDNCPYLEINLMEPQMITCLDIQGWGDIDYSYVQSILLDHSLHRGFKALNSLSELPYYECINLNNRDYIKRIYFDKPFMASNIRIYPLRWVGQCAMRCELYYDASYTYHNMISRLDLFDLCIMKQNKISYHDIFNKSERMMAMLRKTGSANTYWKRTPRHTNILHEAICEGISVLINVMNRTHNITNNMDSWLSMPVNEIIILDWSSAEPFGDILMSYNDKRIRYIRVDGEDAYIRTYAQNLMAELARYDKILKLDSDVSVSRDFCERNILQPGEFIVGEWRCGRDMNERYTHGNLYLYLDDYLMINGYNEFIKTYGWDDSDMTVRLILAGLRPRLFDLDTLYHNPHTNHARKVNMKKVYHPDVETRKHMYCLEDIPKWGRQYETEKYDIDVVDSNMLQVRRIHHKRNIIPGNIAEVSERRALDDVGGWYIPAHKLKTMDLNAVREYLTNM